MQRWHWTSGHGQPMGNPQHNQMQPAHGKFSLKWHILSRFWQGVVIEKSVRFSWTDAVLINSGHVFFIQTSHRAIFTYTCKLIHHKPQQQLNRLWRSLQLCFSRKFACYLTYPLSSVWPELSDLSSALILRSFTIVTLNGEERREMCFPNTMQTWEPWQSCKTNVFLHDSVLRDNVFSPRSRLFKPSILPATKQKQHTQIHDE